MNAFQSKNVAIVKMSGFTGLQLDYSIGPKLAEHIQQVAEHPIDYMRGSYTNSIFLVPVTTGETNRIIDQFKNYSSGWGNIKPSIITNKRSLPCLNHYATLLICKLAKDVHIIS